MNLRVAILGPFENQAVQSFLKPTDQKRILSPGMGGSCLVNLVLARLSRGLPTDVITLDPNAESNIARYDGDLVRLWIIKRRPGKALRDGYRKEVAGLIAALEESRPDICHANWTYEYGLAAIRQRVAPSVTTVHDHAGRMLRHLGWRYAPHYFMSRKVIRKSFRCTSVSPHIADYVNDLRRDDSPVIPNILPETNMVRRTDAASSTIISLLTWAKFRNATTALRAFARFRKKHPDVLYQLVGPGFETGGPAEVWARSHGLEPGVVFNGRVPYHIALEVIARSSILLHPSLEESFGAPVAEAMTLRIPVIAAREAGGPAWLCSSGHGRLVSGHSIEEMTCAMEETWQQLNSSMAEKKLDEAKAYIHALCGADVVLDQWSRLYNEILNTKT